MEDFRLADEQDGSDRPQISVVVPVLNGMPWIEHQLSALAAQVVPSQWEVVVADNGSEDRTRACVERWSERDHRLRLVDASVRPGPGAARNIGVRATRAPMLAFCDADDVVRPGWLAAMEAALSDTDLAAGVFDFSSLNGRPASNPIPAATGHMGFLPFALGANLAVRREAFEAAGGFSETLRAGEDIDLSWRLQLAGYRFRVTPGASVAKREIANGMPLFHAAWAYGRCDTMLYRRYRPAGMRRDLRGATKAWVWLLANSPGLFLPSRRRQWLRSFGQRAGRLTGSVSQHAFFP